MTQKSQILNIAKLLSAGSEGLGTGKSSATQKGKEGKKDFKTLLNKLTGKNEAKSKKLTSKVSKEEVPVILPFTSSKVKIPIVKSNVSAGLNTIIQDEGVNASEKEGLHFPKNVKANVFKNNIRITTTSVPKKGTKNLVGTQNKLKEIVSPDSKKITNKKILPKKLKSATQIAVSKVENVTSTKKSNVNIKISNDLESKVKNENDVNSHLKAPKLPETLKLNNFQNMSTIAGEKDSKSEGLKKISSIKLNMKNAGKIEQKIFSGQLKEKQKTFVSPADSKKSDNSKTVTAEQKYKPKILQALQNETKTESINLSRVEDKLSDPLLNKIEKSAARIIAGESTRTKISINDQSDRGIKIKSGFVAEKQIILQTDVKSISDENSLEKLFQSNDVKFIAQNSSKLIRGTRNSVIHSMESLAIVPISNKLNILQSSAIRVSNETKKKNAPAILLSKVSDKKLKNTKQNINPKSVEDSYSKFQQLSSKSSNTLTDVDNKFLFNAVLETNIEDSELSKLKTSFTKGGMLPDKAKLQENNLMKFTIEEIDKELNRIQLRLTPKGLGNIKIDLLQEGKTMAVKFLVETAEIAKLLKDALPELKETLLQQGINLDESEVSSKKENQAHQFNGRHTGNFEGKNHKNDSQRSPVMNQDIQVPVELLSQKQSVVYSPYSTVEYLA